MPATTAAAAAIVEDHFHFYPKLQDFLSSFKLPYFATIMRQQKVCSPAAAAARFASWSTGQGYTG